MLGKIIRLFIISDWIKLSHCEYPAFPNVNDYWNKCEPSKSSRLVENFFHLIFTEFHTTPPACTCVQMCPDQPAYCYPNGCMKKNIKESDNKSSHEQVRRSAPPQIHNLADTHPVRVFTDDKDDFLSFFEKTHRTNLNTEKPVTPTGDNLKPNIFKDRYNMLIKYRRTPKVELKYNFREQVRTMKSAKLKIESIDLSKTRWPHPKQNVPSHQNVEPDSEIFVRSMAPDNSPTLMSIGSSHKENTEKDSSKKPVLDDAPKLTNKSIDDQDRSNSLDYNVTEVPIEPISFSDLESNETVKRNETSKNKIYVVFRLGESNVVPSDDNTRKLKNLNIDSSVNLTESNNKTYSDMITSLFKSIGKEDKASMERDQFVDVIDNIDNEHFMKRGQSQNNYQTIEMNTKTNRTNENDSLTTARIRTNSTANAKM